MLVKLGSKSADDIVNVAVFQEYYGTVIDKGAATVGSVQEATAPPA